MKEEIEKLYWVKNKCVNFETYLKKESVTDNNYNGLNVLFHYPASKVSSENLLMRNGMIERALKMHGYEH